MFRQFLFLLCLSAAFANTPAVGLGQSMNNQKLYQILENAVDSLEGAPGAWQFTYGDRVMLLLTDEGHDRMRIISPISTVDELSPQQLAEALTANFHTALDARYAISEHLMWSVFMHPLGSLSAEQVLDALHQVHRAAETFGTTYSSSDLVFPGARSGNSKKQNESLRKM